MQDDFTLESYDFKLPQKNIAQRPSTQRDCSKLLVLHRQKKTLDHKEFSNIVDYIQPGDILVINDTKVFPARLLGKKSTGGKVEVFLLEFPGKKDAPSANSDMQYAEANVLVKSSKKPKIGSKIMVSEELHCNVLEHFDNGQFRIELVYNAQHEILSLLAKYGEVPLPPYIERESGTSEDDRERYQTVYAENNGAVAAPTAGLHFTEKILDNLVAHGVELASLTLHVGYGTFAPVRASAIKQHQIHKEYISLSAQTAEKINRIKKRGGKVWAVGTTTVRALEFSSDNSGIVQPTKGWCDLYIIPGFKFSIVDNLITNFHLPQSSLLFLVSALCGRELLLECYEKAIEKDYRFYSYGDAMAILSE